jgi:endonuclease/exonuclease/phosphatase family metal-dependent hydrolase
LDLARIAKVIRSVSPDVVALQEVDDQVRRSGHVKQPAELARLTKMHVVFEKNIDYQGGRYGNAVLSRFPIVQHKNVHLPSFDKGEQRGVLVCKLRLSPPQQPLLFFATHLDHRRQDRERLASAKRINALSDAYEKQPALLVGDLNATRDSDVLARFQKNWQIVHREELPTVPVGKPNRQIDFILARPAGAWKTVEVRVLAEAIASDHRPLFAVLEWTDSQ